MKCFPRFDFHSMVCWGGGDSAPPAPYIPPPPPPPEWVDFMDEVSGTETIEVKGADGKKRRVNRRLPRSPEEQKMFDEAGTIMERSIEEMKKLATINPDAVVDFQPFLQVMNNLNAERRNDIAELTKIPDFNAYVDNFKAMYRDSLEKQHTRLENENQAYLSSRGYGNSTAEREMRNLMGQSRAESLAKVDVEGQEYGERLKAADQANRQNAFAFREQGRAGQLQTAQSEHGLKVDQYNQLESKRQQALQNQKAMFDVAAGVRGEDRNKAMMSKAPDMAFQMHSQNSADSLNRYSAQVNAMNANYQNQLAEHNSRGATFAQSLMGLGGQAVGTFGGAYLGGKGLTMSGLPEAMRKTG